MVSDLISIFFLLLLFLLFYALVLKYAEHIVIFFKYNKYSKEKHIRYLERQIEDKKEQIDELKK